MSGRNAADEFTRSIAIYYNDKISEEVVIR
jgi:hypothetical protein